ncbi:MAG: hypothetical protein K8I00_04835, partial [Candidatus Omnitrophica bacterium]|nr:hypothetical protein [Candidatus Omnitrophota bacterium]
IYDHLAQVYLGKRKKDDAKTKKQFNAWLLINGLITAIIFASVFYGLTAFLTQHRETLTNKVIYSLNQGPMRFSYDFKSSTNPVETFSVSIPAMDLERYQSLEFSIRGKEEGVPGIVKVVIKNRYNESAYFYIQGVDLDWHQYRIPLSEFTQITDWTSVTDISFVLESWNVDNQKGLVLIDNLNLATTN